MMILNEIRWSCIYAIFFIGCFLFLLKDIKKEMTYFFQQQTEKENLLRSIEENKKILLHTMKNQKKSFMKKDNTLLDTSNVLSCLGYFFTAQNITASKMHLLKLKTIDGLSVLPVKISITGSLPAFYKLISSFAGSPQPIVVNSFVLKMDSTGAMQAEVQLWVLAMRIKPLNIQELKNPSLNISAVSVKKMKWVGFIRDEKTILGLLMLPEGTTVAVEVGMMVGLEKGKVVAVNEDGISINVAGKPIKIDSG